MMDGGIGNNKIDGSSEKNKMFFTTSDLMKKMNAAIKDNDSSLPSDTGGFELQRKLPDGSYRPAEEGEMAAADFQTKLKQAAEMTAMLTPQQKLRWAKHQRKEGNKIFAAGEYKDAMDVYLTCLVAMDQSSKENENNTKAVAVEEECEDPIPTAQIEEEIKLPVLLNLALCALKLGMLSKAEKFCNYAIEMDVGKRSVKANFRRGRARMLMGHYVSAELDLARALELNDEATAATTTCDLKEVQSEREAILREMEKLDRLVSQAEKNEETQKKAMERVFQSTTNVNGDSSTKNMTANDSGLYPEKDVPKKLLLEEEEEEEESEDSHLSCFEWYVRMIGRCAQKLLDIIGEDEIVQDEEGIPVDQDLVKQFLANAKEKDD
jgi:tetratricopeptide (TPR) repeat protein